MSEDFCPNGDDSCAEKVECNKEGKVSRMTAIKFGLASLAAGVGLIQSVKNANALYVNQCGYCTLTAKCGSCISGTRFGRKQYVYSSLDRYGRCTGYCYTHCISC